MTTTFQILSRKKIPYWSSFLFALIGTCATFLFILYLAMTPSEHASGEMKVAYYILVIPEWLKQTSAYSFLALIALLPFYSYSKRYKPGMVSLNNDTIIISEGKDTVLPIESISKIIVNDVKSLLKREKAEVILKHGNIIRASFILKHYIQAEQFIEALSIYQNVQFVFYNEMQIQEFDEEAGS